jgi:hypothetical protein
VIAQSNDSCAGQSDDYGNSWRTVTCMNSDPREGRGGGSLIVFYCDGGTTMFKLLVRRRPRARRNEGTLRAEVVLL